MSKEISLQDFLAPISSALGHDEVPRSVPPCASAGDVTRRVHVEGTAELTKAFCDAADAMHVTVHRCESADVARVVAGIISASDKPQVVVPRDERISSFGLDAAFEDAEISCSIWDSEAGVQECRQMCLDASFGVTFPTFGVAETGSVVQLCNQDCGRSISLLPETHIAVLDAASILPQMIDALTALRQDGGEGGRELPSQICFISGPSNTSDIELVRVEGVHGPMYVHYVVIEAASA